MLSAIKIKAGFGAAFAILLGVGIAAVFQTFVWEGSAGWISESWEIIGHVDEAAARANDAEEAARRLSRGFSTADLDRCREDLDRLNRIASELVQLTSANPSRHAEARMLQKLSVSAAEAFDTSVAAGPVVGTMRAVLDPQFETLIQTMRESERALLKQRIIQQRDSAILTRHLSESAAALSFALILLAAWRASLDLKNRNAAERTLAAREEQYRQVVEMAGDIIYRTDHRGRFTFCNKASLALLHLTEREVMGRSYLKLIRHDKRKETERFYLRQLARKRTSSYYEFPVVDGHGRERWVGQNVQLLMDGDKVTGFQAIAREITERRVAERELEKSRTFIERIAATTPGILYVYDLDAGRNVYSNREVITVLGYKPEEIRQDLNAGTTCFHPDDLPALRAHYEGMRKAQDGEVRRIEYRARHASGHWVWLASRDTPFDRTGAGTVHQVVGIAQDITARKAAQERLAYQANFDALTGLANRHHFWTRLESVLRRASIESSTASLCVVDIDQFKEINDRYGHAAGDEVLEALGTILRSELRSRDVAGRLGGDEFAFILPDTDHDESARLAERIRERLRTLPFGKGIAGGPFSVTATFGVAELRPDMDSRDLMEAADRMLYRAKASGRNRVCVDGQARDMQLSNDLKGQAQLGLC